MFQKPFEGWKYGPVSRKVRDAFTGTDIPIKNDSDISNEAKYVVNNIIQQYGGYEP